MTRDGSTAVVTDAGRQLCNQVTTDVFAASDTLQCVSEDAWPRIAETYGFRWNLGSGCRLIGGLPETYTGQPVVDGPHQYVLKIMLTTDTRPDELLSNYIEAIIWDQAVEEGLSHLFAPVIAHGDDYRWIIMEEVVALDKDFWNEHGPVPYLDGWGKELKSQYREFKDTLSEVPGKNIGDAGVDPSGSIVAIDYEHFLGSEWAGMYDREKKRHITFADLRRRNQSDKTTSSGDSSTASAESRGVSIRQWFSSLFS